MSYDISHGVRATDVSEQPRWQVFAALAASLNEHLCGKKNTGDCCIGNSTLL